MGQPTLDLRSCPKAQSAKQLDQLWTPHFPLIGRRWNILLRMALTATTKITPVQTPETASTTAPSPQQAAPLSPLVISQFVAPVCGTRQSSTRTTSHIPLISKWLSQPSNGSEKSGGRCKELRLARSIFRPTRMSALTRKSCSTYARARSSCGMPQARAKWDVRKIQWRYWIHRPESVGSVACESLMRAASLSCHPAIQWLPCICLR